MTWRHGRGSFADLDLFPVSLRSTSWEHQQIVEVAVVLWLLWRACDYLLRQSSARHSTTATDGFADEVLTK